MGICDLWIVICFFLIPIKSQTISLIIKAFKPGCLNKITVGCGVIRIPTATILFSGIFWIPKGCPEISRGWALFANPRLRKGNGELWRSEWFPWFSFAPIRAPYDSISYQGFAKSAHPWLISIVPTGLRISMLHLCASHRFFIDFCPPKVAH